MLGADLREAGGVAVEQRRRRNSETGKKSKSALSIARPRFPKCDREQANFETALRGARGLLPLVGCSAQVRCCAGG